MLKNLATILASTSLPTCSKNGDALTTCNVHQFVRQFGLDQEAVVETGNICIGVRKVETQYTKTVDAVFLATSLLYYRPPWPGEGSDRRAECCIRRGALTPSRVVGNNSFVPRKVAMPITIYV